MTFLDRPRSVFWRRALFQVHLWAGVLAALYVIVVCVTGAALVFRINLQRAVHPDLLTSSGDGPPADVAGVLDTLREAYPGGRVSGVDARTTTRPTYLAYVTTDEQFKTVLIDTVTGQILGELPERSLVRTVQDLHFDLLAGPRGRVVNGIGALCLLVMCLTGLVVWWPGTGVWWRGFTIDWKRPWKRVNWDLHSAVGIWTVVLVAMWSVTGLYFVFRTEFRSAVNWISPTTVSQPPTSDPVGAGGEPRPTWPALIERARQQAPDEFVARVVVPATAQSPFLVLFSAVRPTPIGPGDLRSVYLDQYTGALLQEPQPAARTLGDTIMTWVGPLHVGNFGGGRRETRLVDHGPRPGAAGGHGTHHVVDARGLSAVAELARRRGERRGPTGVEIRDWFGASADSRGAPNPARPLGPPSPHSAVAGHSWWTL